MDTNHSEMFQKQPSISFSSFKVLPQGVYVIPENRQAIVFKSFSYRNGGFFLQKFRWQK